jgi:hypothetical protein
MDGLPEERWKVERTNISLWNIVMFDARTTNSLSSDLVHH